MWQAKKDKLTALLFLNSGIKKDNETGGFIATCFTKKGFEVYTTMFKDKAPIKLNKSFSSKLILDPKEKLNYLCNNNKFLQQLITELELEQC